MKIIYCLHGTYNSGGMERIVISKANYLAKVGHDVSIVTVEQKGRKPFFEIHPKIILFDLHINYANDNDRGFLWKIFSFLIKKVIHRKRLTAYLKTNKADIVISTFGNEATFLPSIKDGSKKIAEIHFSRFFRIQFDRKGLWSLVDKYRSRKDLKLVNKYDKFVCLTYEDKEYWASNSNLVVIPNFISHYPLKCASLKSHTVIAVGRLSYQKGYERLVDAWKIVVKYHPLWILKIFGSGEKRDYVNNCIIESNLEKVIEIHEPTSDIQREYLNSSIFVLSSRYEGLPMVLLEAMSCGLPVVSYDCKCGPKDIIKDGVDGFLVREGDIDDLARKIMLLIESEDLRKQMGTKAYQKSKLYSQETIMTKWEEVFESVVR